MPRYNEFKSCCALITWWSYYSRINKIPEILLLHIPNQAAGGPRRGANLKAMGVRKGCPDYLLAIPRGKHHGLFIEQKAPDGKPTPEQTVFLYQLQAHGYAAAICYSTDAARTAIESYLKQT